MEVALEALGGLLAAVRLPAHALGPLLRACAQALTVDGLHVLQVKAVGARLPFAGEERRPWALACFACAPDGRNSDPGQGHLTLRVQPVSLPG